jgi:hypothetical protein
VIAADAGVMQIQLSEGWVWHRSGDVNAVTGEVKLCSVWTVTRFAGNQPKILGTYVRRYNCICLS